MYGLHSVIETRVDDLAPNCPVNADAAPEGVAAPVTGTLSL